MSVQESRESADPHDRSKEHNMRRISFVLFSLLILPLALLTSLDASELKQVYRQTPIRGDEPAPVSRAGDDVAKPHPITPAAVGTVVDSTRYDYQANGAMGRRIVAVDENTLHITAMVSPDDAFATRGMKYIYYVGGVFTNYGYVEGSGSGDQRAGFGAITGYNVPESGLGSVALTCSHTNLAGRPFGAHFYSFQDAFQGVGAFSPAEGDPGDGVTGCQAFLWPTLGIVNDATGSMAMCGLTANLQCLSGFDNIAVVHKNFSDPDWGTATILPSMDEPLRWSGTGPDIPIMDGSDTGRMGIVTSEFGTNVWWWESTDGGMTWSDRQDVTGFPVTPHHVPPDTTSTEYRPLQAASIAMARDGTPHIVWPAYQAEGNADSVYTPGVDGVFSYRTKLEHWDPVHGVTTIYRHPAGIANAVVTTQFAYNVGHMSIGFGPTDDFVYVVYEGYLNTDIDPTNGVNYGDIYVSYSTDAGATWSDRINITNSPGSDDLYPGIARYNPQGIVQELEGFSVGDADGINDFVMIYQNDNVAGTFLGGDETSGNWDKLYVAPVDFAAIPQVGIGDDNGGGAAIPKAFALGQNYPNPFNPTTSISYELAEAARVTLRVHNVRGQVVRELVNGTQEPGTHSVQWDGKDSAGRTVSSGIYLYTLETDHGFQATKKMVVLK
jgi:hypothetical protein